MNKIYITIIIVIIILLYFYNYENDSPSNLDNKKLKIAVCFIGLCRSTHHTIDSIKSNIYQPLDDLNIDYDIYLHKENMCSRTVCSHYDLDPREYMSTAGRPLPFAPHGAVDGFVCDTKMAKKMMICGRFGNSCGTPFIKDTYIEKHRQYENFGPYLKDRPSEPWTDLSEIKQQKNKFYLTRRNKNNKFKKRTQKN